MDKTKETPTPEEVKVQETAKAEADKKVADAAIKDAKVGDVVQEPIKEVKTVPEAVFLEEKKERKELARKVKELEQLVSEGLSKGDSKNEIKEIADEFGITEEAVSKLIKTVGQKTRSEVEKEISEKFGSLEVKNNAEKVQKTFDEHFDKLIEAMPEYKKLANKEVIRTLSLDPKNANKTFSKILEEAYGHLVTGKPTIETTQARAGNSDTALDYSKLNNSEYLKEVFANPELKAKYNEGLLNRLRL